MKVISDSYEDPGNDILSEPLISDLECSQYLNISGFVLQQYVRDYKIPLHSLGGNGAWFRWSEVRAALASNGFKDLPSTVNGTERTDQRKAERPRKTGEGQMDTSEPNGPGPEQALTAEQCAGKLNTSLQSFRRWVREYGIPVHRNGVRSVRYYWSEVLEALAKNGLNSPKLSPPVPDTPRPAPYQANGPTGPVPPQTPSLQKDEEQP